MHLTAVIGEIGLNTALILTELHDGADIFIRHKNRHRIDRLTNLIDLVDRRELRGVFHLHDFAVGHQHLINDGRSRRDEIHVVLALQPLLHDVHVQETKEARAEAEAERLGAFGLKTQRRIVKLKLREGVAQRVVLI